MGRAPPGAGQGPGVGVLRGRPRVVPVGRAGCGWEARAFSGLLTASSVLPTVPFPPLCPLPVSQFRDLPVIWEDSTGNPNVSTGRSGCGAVPRPAGLPGTKRESGGAGMGPAGARRGAAGARRGAARASKVRSPTRGAGGRGGGRQTPTLPFQALGASSLRQSWWSSCRTEPVTPSSLPPGPWAPRPRTPPTSPPPGSLRALPSALLLRMHAHL